MSLQPEPDVAFGTTPSAGVAAAVADNRPSSVHETLRQHGFGYNPRLRVYLLLADANDHSTAVRAVAGATRQLQDAGWSVAADPRAVVPPDPEGTAPLSGQRLEALIAALHSPAEVAEVVRNSLDEGIGAVEELDDLVDTATTWCDHLDSAEGREMAQRLRHIKTLVTSVNDHVMSTVMELEDMSQGAPKNTPARPEAPHRERQEGLPAHHTARSHAATAISPQRPVPTPQSAFPQSAPPAQSPPGNRRTR